MDKPTIDFYNLHANEQAALYETADMSSMYNRLATLLKDKGKILEIGCGSGRDARALANMGFSVVATDASEGMIREAKRLSAGKVCGLSFAWLPFPISKNHILFTVSEHSSSTDHVSGCSVPPAAACSPCRAGGTDGKPCACGR